MSWTGLAVGQNSPDDMCERLPRAAYPAKLKVDSWQIVIPTIAKISPICFNADFRSLAEAKAWMRTEEAQRLLAFAQTNGRIQPPESNKDA
jgi:hypothetical protein